MGTNRLQKMKRIYEKIISSNNDNIELLSSIENSSFKGKSIVSFKLGVNI